ncbi:MAG TPA: hypothetical protein VGM07_06220 [Stellaceae bacterium]|jgi:hypothetical protein
MTAIVDDYAAIRGVLPSAERPSAGDDAILSLLCGRALRIGAIEEPQIEMPDALANEWFDRASEIEHEVITAGASPVERAVKRYLLGEFDRLGLRREGHGAPVDQLERSLMSGAH